VPPVRRKLNNTAVVVLGLVDAGRRNGYEIQQAIGRSTRYFWSASPGGIYPELKRLEDDGLLASSDDPRGEGARHSYEITPAGREALREWVTDEDEGLFEMRNEDLLRLFFASGLDTEGQVGILRRIRRRHEDIVEQLETVTRPVAEANAAPQRLLVLEYGVAMHRSAADWCAAAERELGG
jgi:DNA-binding PadR family transcriptional regulator